MKGLHILIVGHACFPNMGSEAGVTWNWAWHLAERNRVWVIAHGFARPLVEQYMRDHPRPNLRFIWVGPLGWWDPWRNPGPTKARGLVLHYLLWRHAALAAAQRLMAMEAIDIVHHVSWNSISAPPLLWRTGKPFVWGPIGGGHALPWRFLTSIGHSALRELLRNLRVRVMPWTPGLRRTVARTDLLLAANGETAGALKRAGAAHVKLLPDIGVPAELLQPPSPERAARPYVDRPVGWPPFAFQRFGDFPESGESRPNARCPFSGRGLGPPSVDGAVYPTARPQRSRCVPGTVVVAGNAAALRRSRSVRVHQPERHVRGSEFRSPGEGLPGDVPEPPRRREPPAGRRGHQGAQALHEEARTAIYDFNNRMLEGAKPDVGNSAAPATNRPFVSQTSPYRLTTPVRAS